MQLESTDFSYWIFMIMLYSEGLLILSQLIGKWFLTSYLKIFWFIGASVVCFWWHTLSFNLSLIECDKVRLMGGSRCAGRVEIYHGNSWGTVCDDRWSLVNADVVCRELKCGTVLEAKKAAFFGEGKDRIWLDDVQCTGTEASILKCAHRDFGENNCGHGEDAGVICSGKSDFTLSFVLTWP